MSASDKAKPIPHPPEMPVVGNLFTISRKAPIEALVKLARQYGPIFSLDIMGRSLVIVSGADLVNELCDQKRFDKSLRGGLGGARRFAGDGLFTATTGEPNWRKAHNILLPNFGQAAMHGYHSAMVEVAEQLVLKWGRLNAEDDIDVVHDMTALTLETIGICGFGYRFNSFYREGSHPFVNAMTGALEATMKVRGLPMEHAIFWRREQRLRADIELMNAMVDRIIADRKATGGDTSVKADLLGYMLSGVDKATGERLDDLNIRYQIITFLIAGHETTSGLLSFAMYYLLEHADVLAKCYDEVDRVLGGDLGTQPNYAQVTQLT